jgi:hypothetical protein
MTEVSLQILIDNVDSETPIWFVRNDSRPPKMYDFFVFIDLYFRGSERYVSCCHQDPLDGGNFWFTHHCGFPVEMVLGYKVVELPFVGEFQIDSFEIWKKHNSTMDVLLIKKMFRSAVQHLVANGLISSESDLHSRPVDEHFEFFAHDLTSEGLQRVRSGYRKWTEQAFVGGNFDTVDW